MFAATNSQRHLTPGGRGRFGIGDIGGEGWDCVNATRNVKKPNYLLEPHLPSDLPPSRLFQTLNRGKGELTGTRGYQERERRRISRRRIRGEKRCAIEGKHGHVNCQGFCRAIIAEPVDSKERVLVRSPPSFDPVESVAPFSHSGLGGGEGGGDKRVFRQSEVCKTSSGI